MFLNLTYIRLAMARKKAAPKKNKKEVSENPSKDKETGIGPIPTIPFTNISTTSDLGDIPALDGDDVPQPSTNDTELTQEMEQRLRELQDLADDFAKSSHDSVDEFMNKPVPPPPQQPSTPPKKGFWSSLFGKKEPSEPETSPKRPNQEPQLPQLGTKTTPDSVLSADQSVTPSPDIHSVNESIIEEVSENNSSPTVTQEDKPVKEISDTESLEKTVASEPIIQSDPKEDHATRYVSYVENLHRRVDMEMRERQQHVKELEKELDERSKQIELMEDKILKREMKLAQHKELADKIKELEHTIDDQTITLKYQDEQLTALRKDLASAKQDAQEHKRDKDQSAEQITQLTQQLEQANKQLEQTNKELEKAQQENKNLKQTIKQMEQTQVAQEQEKIVSQVDLEDDAIAYLSDKLEHDKSHFEAEIEQLHKQLKQRKKSEHHQSSGENKPKQVPVEPSVAKPVQDNQKVMTQDLRKELMHGIAACNQAIDANDTTRAKRLYGELRRSYSVLRAASGDSPLIHQHIMDIYERLKGNQ